MVVSIPGRTSRVPSVSAQPFDRLRENPRETCRTSQLALSHLSHQGSLPNPRSSFLEIRGKNQLHTTGIDPSVVKAEVSPEHVVDVFVFTTRRPTPSGTCLGPRPHKSTSFSCAALQPRCVSVRDGLHTAAAVAPSSPPQKLIRTAPYSAAERQFMASIKGEMRQQRPRSIASGRRQLDAEAGVDRDQTLSFKGRARVIRSQPPKEESTASVGCSISGRRKARGMTERTDGVEWGQPRGRRASSEGIWESPCSAIQGITGSRGRAERLSQS
jgi:hypothetical protein